MHRPVCRDFRCQSSSVSSVVQHFDRGVCDPFDIHTTEAASICETGENESDAREEGQKRVESPERPIDHDSATSWTEQPVGVSRVVGQPLTVYWTVMVAGETEQDRLRVSSIGIS